jgi:1,4-dihydroxy-2-naphthoate octaprenyltransferase
MERSIQPQTPVSHEAAPPSTPPVDIQPPASGFGAWYRAVRPRTLSASVSPVLVGSALALGEGFSVLRFVLALLGSVAIQAGTNMLNEHFDHVQGLDLTRPRRRDQVVQTGVLAPRALLWGGVAAMVVGSLCGLALVALTGPALLAIGVLSVLAGYAYTARPLALGYRALGEVTVFVFMGCVIVMGAHYVHTERWTWQAFFLSIPMGQLVAAILHVNNVRDMAYDRANGKRTLANVLGRRAAGWEYALLVPGAFVTLAVLLVVRVLPWTAALALLLLPAAVRLTRAIMQTEGVFPLDRVMIGTARLHLRFGLLLAAGLAWDALG